MTYALEPTTNQKVASSSLAGCIDKMAALSGSHLCLSAFHSAGGTPMRATSFLRRRCSKCGLVKSVDEFNFRYRERGVRHGYCRECGKELTRSHYKRKKPSYLKRNLRAYADRRQLVLEAKSRPCADYGFRPPGWEAQGVLAERGSPGHQAGDSTRDRQVRCGLCQLSQGADAPAAGHKL
jgi:hypothetical protein